MDSLRNAKLGSIVTVKELSAAGMLRERMLVWTYQRAKVEVIRKGPSGDPTVYKFAVQ